jgi:hypothetical protein
MIRRTENGTAYYLLPLNETTLPGTPHSKKPNKLQMRRSIILTNLLLMLIASEGISQTIDLPVQDVKRVMIRLERLKVDSIELQLRKADISDLQALSLSQANTIANLRASVQAQQLQASNLSAQITLLHKEVRRQKKNKVFAIIGGILTSSAILYLTH